jgi:hypothetical protein
MTVANDKIELNNQTLDQVGGGCGHRHIRQMLQSDTQQPAQQNPNIADISALIAGARIKF